ncbi:MAG TPA: GGDEF domain-containing protein [Candidatus Limnocylindrales bacterium]
MNQNVLILIVFLVAANLVLITVAAVRALRRDRRGAGTSYDADVVRQPLPSGAAAPLALTPSELASSRDPLTGLLLLREWNRILVDEDARVSRYRHPATIVIIELDGFDRLTATLGAVAGERVLPALADALSRNARAADHIARLGTSRFGIMLTETGEVEAINYIERVREACDMWLESGAIAMRLSIGWASPGPDSNLAAAVLRAHERMFLEQRRNERTSAAIPVPAQPAVHETEGSPSLA